MKNSPELVTILLQYKPPINVGDNNGSTALHFACEAGYLDIVKLLVTTGSSEINQTDMLKFTPLHFAAAGGYIEIVQFLLSNKTNIPDIQNISGIYIYFFIQLPMILPNQITLMKLPNFSKNSIDNVVNKLYILI